MGVLCMGVAHATLVKPGCRFWGVQMGADSGDRTSDPRAAGACR